MMKQCCAMLNKIVLLRGMLQKFEKQLLKYDPFHTDEVRNRAVVLTLEVCVLVGILVAVVLMSGGFSFESVCIMFSSIYMIVNYLLYKITGKEEKKLLEELEKFLGELRFQYSYCHRMDEALEECMMQQDGLMAQHAGFILRYMEQGIPEEEPVFANRYLALLAGLCKIVFTYGACLNQGELMCLTGIEMLKNQVEKELLHIRRKEHMFSGLLIICMIPMGCMKVIERWSVSNMQELSYYYEGSYGMVTTVLLCAGAVVCFSLVQHMQYSVEPVTVYRKWLSKLQQVPCIRRLLVWQINRNYDRSLKKHRCLQECGVSENMMQFILLQYVTAVVTGLAVFFGILCFRQVHQRQFVLYAQKAVKEVYQLQENEQRILNAKLEQVIKGEETAQSMEQELKQCPAEVADVIRQTIVCNRKKWVTWRIGWYVWLFPVLCGIAAYHFRYRWLRVKRYFCRFYREEEILNLQSVIIFLMYQEAVSSETIVQWLETYAFYFRERIWEVQFALENQEYERIAVFVDEEQYLPLKRILEGISACDHLPVAEALGQTPADYTYNVERYVQDRADQLQDYGAVCKVLAFLPLYMTIGMKLMIPFVLEGLSKLSAYAQNMKQFMN